MNSPSSRHLSHDFPAYKGLSLRELASIALVATVGVMVLFTAMGFVLGWPVGFACLGLIVGFIVSVSVLPKPIAKRKAGKPHGYLMKLVTIGCARWGFKPSPYVQHTGLWQKSKRIGEHLV